MSKRCAFLFFAMVLSGCAADQPGPSPAVPADHTAKVQAWRDKHEVDYRRDWVSIAGLYFLSPGTHTIGSNRTSNVVLGPHVPARLGTLTVADGNVRFDAARGIVVMQKNAAVPGPVVMKAAATPPAPEIVIGDVRLVVHESGERLSLRIRDPQGELAKGFLGFTWFPIDPAYRVVGRFIKDAESRKLQVLNTFNDVDTYATDGVVEFTLQGQTLRLRPFTTRPKRFYFVFRDASGGHETYKTARFLYADLLDDGTSVLDFNEAYNPPCAFNPYTTCPIPLKENVLPVKILAGEKAYPVEVKLPGGRPLGMHDHLQRTLDVIEQTTAPLSVDELGRHLPGKWSIAEMVEHLTLTFAANARGFEKAVASGHTPARPPALVQRLGRVLVVGTGYFPRRESPKAAVPSGTIPPERVRAAARDALEALDAAMQQAADRFGDGTPLLNHPYFAGMNIRQWRKFHWRHAVHHMKQARAIINS